MSEAALLPCPFCRSEATVVEDGTPFKDDDGNVVVPPGCVGCSPCGIYMTGDGETTLAGAIAAWNRRAPVRAAITESQLNALGGYFGDGSAETISIEPDDALRNWRVRVGRRTFAGAGSAHMALLVALAELGDQ